MKDKVITLADVKDTYAFRIGTPVILNMYGRSLRYQRLVRLLDRLTRPFRKISGVVSAVDHKTGTITVSPTKNPFWRFIP